MIIFKQSISKYFIFLQKWAVFFVFFAENRRVSVCISIFSVIYYSDFTNAEKINVNPLMEEIEK